jgi:putative glutamine amidotransferase
MATDRPLIGVSACSKLRDYVESVRAAGGEPVVLEPDADPRASVERVDGLLLTGGGDVEPSLYGAARHPRCDEPDAVRDRFEIAVLRAALDRDLPVLAICRGMQVLNVVESGDLIQDLPSQATSDVDHRRAEPRDGDAHPIDIVDGSLLHRLLGDRVGASGRCSVNSRHHQAVGRVAPSLRVVATAPDGVVEAVERPASRFCLGVQWHPENFIASGRFTRLFEGFVAAARDPSTRADR